MAANSFLETLKRIRGNPTAAETAVGLSAKPEENSLLETLKRIRGNTAATETTVAPSTGAKETVQSDGWFQAGALGDGFSLKNLAKTILGI